MSYILDALRKAEHGRQATPSPTVPIVSEPVPQAPVDRRRRALGALLVAAVAAAAVAAFLHLGREPQANPVAASTSTSTPTSTTAPPAAPATTAARPLSGEVLGGTPAQTVAREPARALDREALRGRAADAPPRQAPAAAAPAPASTRPARPTPGTVTVMGESPTPPRSATSADLSLPAAAGASGDVPRYADLLMNGRLNLPNLRMDMHVFNSDPAKRFVFINLRKYREGERVEDRATVDTITRDGAVLSHNGIRFLLLPD